MYRYRITSRLDLASRLVIQILIVITITFILVEVRIGVIHGFWNFFDIKFDRLHFSKHTDQCVRIKSPKYF